MTPDNTVALAASYLGMAPDDPLLFSWRDAPATAQLGAAFDTLNCRLFVFCTSRSGSELFIDQLRNYGIAAEEHLNRGIPLALEERMESDPEFLLRVASESPYRNFGIKVTHEKMVPFFVSGELPAHTSRWAFVNVLRRNVVAQAVSLVLAERTGAWRSDKLRGVQVPPEGYDFDAIFSAVDRITWTEGKNLALMGKLGVWPYQVYYEDIAADPEGVSAAAAKHLGLAALDADVEKFPLLRRIRPARQASEINALWEERFRSDLAAARVPDIKQPLDLALAEERRRSEARLRSSELLKRALQRENDLLYDRIHRLEAQSRAAGASTIKSHTPSPMAAARVPAPASVRAPAATRRAPPAPRPSFYRSYIRPLIPGPIRSLGFRAMKRLRRP